MSVGGQAPSGYRVDGQVFDFRPAGLTFAVPIAVTFPSGRPGESVFWTVPAGQFEALATTYDSGAGATAFPTHFSSGFVGMAASADASVDGPTDSSPSDATLRDASGRPDGSVGVADSGAAAVDAGTQDASDANAGEALGPDAAGAGVTCTTITSEPFYPGLQSSLAVTEDGGCTMYVLVEPNIPVTLYLGASLSNALVVPSAGIAAYFETGTIAPPSSNRRTAPTLSSSRSSVDSPPVAWRVTVPCSG